MEQRPLFSIIICVYNNEKYLPYAIESVLSQDFSDYEIIIIDDGSTDNTGLIVDDYAKNNKHIKCFHQENQWIYKSFNNGINKSAGEYFLILNSDDRLKAGALKLLSEKIREYNNPDVVWAQVQINDYNTETDTWKDQNKLKKIEEEQYLSSQKELSKKWVYLRDRWCTSNQANLYKKDMLGDKRFGTRWLGEDQIFNITIAHNIKTSLIIKEQIYDHMQYHSDKMNVAGRGYRGYESEMFDYIYSGNINLLKEWNADESDFIFFINERKKSITSVTNLIRKNKNAYSINEYIERLLNDSLTEIAAKCISDDDQYKEELEARIFSAIREKLIEANQEEYKGHPIALMIESLCRYEKDTDDIDNIKNGIAWDKNPWNIGSCFWNKLN